MNEGRRVELGKRVRAARVSRQETQQEVASAVDIHRTHLSRIESGGENITLDTLWALADHFGVSAQELMPDDELREHIAELVADRDDSAAPPDDRSSAEVEPWLDEALSRGVTHTEHRDTRRDDYTS